MINEIEQTIRSEMKGLSVSLQLLPIEVVIDKFNRGDIVGDILETSFTEEVKSAWIESMILGIPPYNNPIYLKEKQDYYLIIMGLEFIKALVEFTSGELVLKGLSRLPILNGKIWDSLSPARQKRFLRTTAIVTLEQES